MYAFSVNTTLLGLAVLLIGSAAEAATVGQPSSRIVNGIPANDVDIPYVVSLVTYGFHTCGGSIINQRTVITAAHCLAQVPVRLLKVHAGAKTRSLSEGVLLSVADVHYNQRWTMDTMDYDIGLVRLSTPFTFGPTIQPIRLVSSGDIIRVGSLATVAGWGFVSVIGPGSDILRYARVPIINQDTCNRLMRGAVTDRMLCAGYLSGGTDACQMDSGGPLVANERLIGIVSWGVGCALPNKPGVYSRITALVPWVEEVLAHEYNEVL